MFIFSASYKNQERYYKSLTELPKSDEIKYLYHIYPVYNGKGEVLTREEFYVEKLQMEENWQYVYTSKYDNGFFNLFLKSPIEEIETKSLYKSGKGDHTNFYLNIEYYILYMKNTKQLSLVKIENFDDK